MNSVEPYRVGEFPTKSLAIVVDDVEDLNEYDSVTVSGLPTGTYGIDPGNPKQILYTFTQPFSEAGHYEADVILGKDGGLDYATSFALDVDEAPLAAIVSPTDAYKITTEHTDKQSLLRAQVRVSARLDRDLFDEDWLDTLSAADWRRLQAIVAWTSLMPVVSIEQSLEPGIKSKSVGDVSVTYSDTSATIETALQLHPIAEQIMYQLSWIRGSNTLFNTTSNTINDEIEYTNETAFMGPIVNYPVYPRWWGVGDRA